MSNQTQRDGWRTLFTTAQRLVHSWWQSDRIRVSPTAGELLRLRPPCCLYLDGQYAQIVDREVLHGTTTVAYHCRTRCDAATLIVKFDSTTAKVAIEWHQGAHVVELLEADVEVFGQ